MKKKENGSAGGAENSRAAELGMFSLGSADNYKIWMNIAVLATGFLFGGCHLIFGSYPLGLGLVSVLPVYVLPATVGVCIGSLTLGKSGIIYAMITVLAVFLRIVISGKDKNQNGESALFSEGLALRMSSAVISGFVSALYEVLLSGVSLESVLFSVAMIVLPPLITLLLFGLFVCKIGVRELIFGGKRVFSGASEGEEYNALLMFRASILVLILLLSVSLSKYDVFGISPSFIFAGLVTGLCAKRFGPLYAAAVGFFASVGVSGLYSVAFMLAGAVSGVIFPFGAIYALASGLTALSLWGAYVGGLTGFLSVFPEYLISCCLCFPIFKYIEREESAPRSQSVKRKATDMVGTMALAHRNRKSLALEEVEASLSGAVGLIRDFSEDEGAAEDYTVFLRMIKEIKDEALTEREMNEALTDRLEEIAAQHGFSDGVIRAFGSKRPYFVLSGEDRDGVKITDPALRAKIESICQVKLTKPEYFRRDDMVLMECSSDKRYKLKCANARMASTSGEVSGDSVCVFENEDGYAFGLISDGMGNGALAKKTSEFATSFLKAMLSSGATDTTVIHALNSLIRRGGEECSASVDLFTFDTVKGEASFIKSGAAPSYIKKADSLFRIKSETMPLGLLRSVDAERTATEVASGDVIIMLSDGIIPSADDAAWLPELLNRPMDCEVGEYAKRIIETALANGAGEDDMSVLVMRIDEA